jgi:hypothetical protein
MKYLILIIVLIISFSCDKDKKEENYIEPINSISACGKTNPLNELDWLSVIAEKSLTEKGLDYVGNIWIVTVNKSDIIVTNMSLGDGNIWRHYFDCSGNSITDQGIALEADRKVSDLNVVFSSYKH